MTESNPHYQLGNLKEEHRLYVRFVGLRRSEELRVSLKEDEEVDLLCGTSGFAWPTLREA